MRSKRSNIGDDENTSFEVPEVLEELKPGLDDREETGEAAEGHHSRFPRGDRKEIPQESLAARVRKAQKGG